jgi:hypothetical protein
MQGAGGVGGLISMTVYSARNAGTYFYCYDGNGNVVAMVNAATGAIAGNWEYGPFGELIRATGPLAFQNPFLFSTKFTIGKPAFITTATDITTPPPDDGYPETRWGRTEVSITKVRAGSVDTQESRTAGALTMTTGATWELMEVAVA